MIWFLKWIFSIFQTSNFGENPIWRGFWSWNFEDWFWEGKDVRWQQKLMPEDAVTVGMDRIITWCGFFPKSWSWPNHNSCVLEIHLTEKSTSPKLTKNALGKNSLLVGCCFSSKSQDDAPGSTFQGFLRALSTCNDIVGWKNSLAWRLLMSIANRVSDSCLYPPRCWQLKDKVPKTRHYATGNPSTTGATWGHPATSCHQLAKPKI